MNNEDVRHIAGAVRNNMTHNSPFEPVSGHRLQWRDGDLYRLTLDGGQTPVMNSDEIYGMDDETLHARVTGEKPPVREEPPVDEEEYTAPVFPAFGEESSAEEEAPVLGTTEENQDEEAPVVVEEETPVVENQQDEPTVYDEPIVYEQQEEPVVTEQQGDVEQETPKSNRSRKSRG